MFSAGLFFQCATSLSRQRHFLDFALALVASCSQSRALHVSLTNAQTFGFEFHLGLLTSAISGQLALVLALVFDATPC